MAANCARRALMFSNASPSSILRNCNKASPFKLNSAKPTSSSPKFAISRLPVELSSTQSLMPLHNVTASALFTSLLSLKSNRWGYLSEGFATTL